MIVLLLVVSETAISRNRHRNDAGLPEEPDRGRVTHTGFYPGDSGTGAASGGEYIRAFGCGICLTRLARRASAVSWGPATTARPSRAFFPVKLVGM